MCSWLKNWRDKSLPCLPPLIAYTHALDNPQYLPIFWGCHMLTYCINCYKLNKTRLVLFRHVEACLAIHDILTSGIWI